MTELEALIAALRELKPSATIGPNQRRWQGEALGNVLNVAVWFQRGELDPIRETYGEAVAAPLARYRADIEHQQRGEVKCESCGKWTGNPTPTLDDCYLCPRCAKQAPKATDEELREYGIID